MKNPGDDERDKAGRRKTVKGEPRTGKESSIQMVQTFSPSESEIAIRFNPAPVFSPPALTFAGIPDILRDERQRRGVADWLELALSTEDFLARFGNHHAPQSIKEKRDCEMERVTRWLEWRAESPAEILSRAWDENDGGKRSLLLAKWMLMEGTEADRKELKRLQKKPRTFNDAIKAATDYVVAHGTPPQPPPANVTITDAAKVFALVVLKTPEDTSFRSLTRSLIDGWKIEADDAWRRTVQEALNALGFSSRRNT